MIVQAFFFLSVHGLSIECDDGGGVVGIFRTQNVFEMKCYHTQTNNCIVQMYKFVLNAVPSFEAYKQNGTF